MSDLKFAIRQLRKNPGFAAVAVLTLALGIGANTAMFSVLSAVLLRPLPYPNADQLVWLSELAPNGDESPIAFPNFEDWRAQQKTFDQMGVYKRESAVLTGMDEAAQLEGSRVSAGLLNMLGVQPLIGRPFLPEDDKPDAARTVLISHSLWQSPFGGSPNVLGSQIILDQESHTIIGVMSQEFQFPSSVDYWVPVASMAIDVSWQNRRNYPGLHGVGRLAPGVTLRQARENLNHIAAGLEQQYPHSNKGRRVQLERLHDHFVAGARSSLWTLWGAVALVLLIACVNITNLLLARTSVRQRELSLRAALGASRIRIVRQILTESVLLAGVGGAAGLLLAVGLLKLLTSRIAPNLQAADISLDGRVLFYASALALLSGIVAGLAPAWRSARASLQESLRDGTRSATGRGSGLRHTFVVAEVSITLLLLIGFGLVLRSFQRLETLNPGFSTDRVLTFEVDLPQRQYDGPERVLAFYDSLLEKLRSVPGVEGASIGMRTPLTGGGRSTSYVVDGEPVPDPPDRPLMNVQVAGPDYFRVVGTPILKGRSFSRQDNREHLQINGGETYWASALNVVIIGEDFAQRHWPNTDPVGKRIRLGFREDAPWMTVVGVVPKIKWRNLNEQGGFPQAYIPFLQAPQLGMKVVVKTSAETSSINREARQIVASLDPNQPISAIKALDDLRYENVSSQRLQVALLGLFGLVALGLAVVGLYGVLAYGVSQRRREIGIRLALGARRSHVLGLIIGEGMRLALFGAGIGLAMAFGFSRLLRGLLYEIKPLDPITFLIVPVVLLFAAFCSCCLPARRAASVDPMVALRND